MSTDTGLIKNVHHITLLVKDLDDAIARWRDQLGVLVFQKDEIVSRGVHTARFQVGATWIVLVQPVAEGEPMRVLRERGEGLFLLSFGVDDADLADAHVKAGGGATTSLRRGLDNWYVFDIEPASLAGSQIQLTEDRC